MTAKIPAICGVRTYVSSYDHEEMVEVATDTYYNWPYVSSLVKQPEDMLCVRTQADPKILLGFTFTLLIIGLLIGILFGALGKGIYRRVKKEPT